MTGVSCVMAGIGSSATVISLSSPVNLFYGDPLAGAIVGYQVSSDGFVKTAENSTGTYSNFARWISSGGVVGDYEARASLVSGTSPSGSAVGSWLVLSSPRAWSVSAPPAGSTLCTLTIEIRDTATSTVRATATVNLDAEGF